MSLVFNYKFSKKGCMLKALIFDLDGTLLDTKNANYLSYKEAFGNIGINFDRQLYDDAFGLCFEDMVRKVHPGLTNKQKLIVKKDKSVFYEKYKSKVRGNSVLIKIIKNSIFEYKIALVTTARKNNAMMLLKHFDLEKYFDVMIFGEDVDIGKPNPECYKVAISRLDLNPSQCMIFEDSDAGLRAASESGANVINVYGWV